MATPAKASSLKKKKPTTIKKSTPKVKAKSVAKPHVKKTATTSQKVDYYPNRMTLAISVLAATLLVLISLIAVLGVQ